MKGWEEVYEESNEEDAGAVEAEEEEEEGLSCSLNILARAF
jgi:hypothetical protein